MAGIVRSHGGFIIVYSEVGRLDGPATIRALRRLDPKVKIIATGGWKAEDKIAHAAQLDVKTFLPKPYTAERLLKPWLRC